MAFKVVSRPSAETGGSGFKVISRPKQSRSLGVGGDGLLPGGKGNLDRSRAGDNWATYELSEEGIPKHYVLPTLPDDRPGEPDSDFMGDAVERFKKTGQHYGAFDTDEDGEAFMRSAPRRGILANASEDVRSRMPDGVAPGIRAKSAFPNELPRPDQPEEGFLSALPKQASQAAAGVRQMAGGIIQYLEENPVSAVEGSVDPVREEDRARLVRARGQSALLTRSGIGAHIASAAAKDIADNTPNVRPFSASGVAGTVLQSAPLMIGAAITTFLTKNPIAGAAVMAPGVFAQEYASERQEGVSPEGATVGALVNAISESAGEQIPLGMLMKPGGKFLANTLKTAAAEGVQETLTEIVQAGYDKGVLHPEMTWGEFGSRVAQAGLAGTVMGGGLSAATQPFVSRETAVAAPSPAVDATPPADVLAAPDVDAAIAAANASILMRPTRQAAPVDAVQPDRSAELAKGLMRASPLLNEAGTAEAVRAVDEVDAERRGFKVVSRPQVDVVQSALQTSPQDEIVDATALQNTKPPLNQTPTADSVVVPEPQRFVTPDEARLALRTNKDPITGKKIKGDDIGPFRSRMRLIVQNEKGPLQERPSPGRGGVDPELSVLENIKRLGGIKVRGPDGERSREGSDILAVLTDVKRPGLINNKNGMAPDRIREAFQQAGWFGPRSDKGADLQDLYDLVDKEVRQGRQYHPDSQAALDIESKRIEEDNERGLQEIRDRADAMGVPYKPDWSHYEIDAAITEREAMQASDDELPSISDQRHEEVAREFDRFASLYDDPLERAYLTDDESLARRSQGPALQAEEVVGEPEAPADGAPPLGRIGQEATGRSADEGARRFAVEPGAEALPQTIIPGAERSEGQARQAMTDRAKLEMKARQQQSKIGRTGQQAAGGMFDEARNQTDLLSQPSGKAGELPPVKNGFVRFFHGGSRPTEASETRWVTPYQDYARNYRGGQNDVFYVDVPKSDRAAVKAQMWDEVDELGQTNMVGRYGNTELPPQWAQKLKPVPGSTKSDTGIPATGDGKALQAPASPGVTSTADYDALTEPHWKALRALGKDTEAPGDVRLNVPGKGKFVPFETAMGAARKAVAAGMRPFPAQVSQWLDVNFPAADRIIAELKKPQGDGTRASPITVEHPDHLADAGKMVNQEPTEAQKEAGNFQKGHVKAHGLDITIENPKGSERSGKGKDGKPWSVTMPAAYGYVKRTTGADGDQFDVYLGPNPDAPKVYVVDQVDAETGKFDEHKALLGFNSREEAVAAYEAGFSDGKGRDRIGGVKEMPVPQFALYLKAGKTGKPLTDLQGLPKVDRPAASGRTYGGSAEYEAANVKMNAAQKVYNAAREKFNARTMGFEEFGKAQEKYKAAQAEFDTAFNAERDREDAPVSRETTKPKGLFAKRADEKAPTFFSALQRGLEGMKQEKAPALQWRSAIKNMQGIKQDEVAWSGVDQWLDERKGQPTTKAELLDFLRNNDVQVKEVTKGETRPTVAQAKDFLRYELEGNDPEQEFGFSDPEEYINEAINRGLDTVEGTPTNTTKFAQYALPGGKNYRELLLTLPNPGDKLDARRREIEALGTKATPEQRQEWAGIMNRLKPDSRDIEGVSRFKGAGFEEFRSSHWDEPNVLAHVRFDEREGPNGERILHVAEIQSDFGQKLRKVRSTINAAIESDFDGIVERMKRSGVLKEVCD